MAVVVAYKGESWSKKMARFMAWQTLFGVVDDVDGVLRLQQVSGGVPAGVRALVLAGLGGDVPILRSLGVLVENVVAVDTELALLEMLGQRFAGLDVRHTTALKALRAMQPASLDRIFLDYCGPFRNHMADEVVAGFRALVPGGTLAINVMRAREKNRLERVGSRTEWKQIRRATQRLMKTSPPGEDKAYGRSLLHYMDGQYGMALKETPEEAQPLVHRVFCIDYVLSALVLKRGQILESLGPAIAYHSGDGAVGAGSPMMTLAWRKPDDGTIAENTLGVRQVKQVVPGEAERWIKELVASGQVAPEFLNVPTPTAAAWKAWHTRRLAEGADA